MSLPVHSTRVTSDVGLLRFIGNICAVLLTRGILGTYVTSATPPSANTYLRPFFS
jgi:hypothetical protein